MDVVHAVAVGRLAHPRLVALVEAVEDGRAVRGRPVGREPAREGRLAPRAQGRDVFAGEPGRIAVFLEVDRERTPHHPRLRVIEPQPRAMHRVVRFPERPRELLHRAVVLGEVGVHVFVRGDGPFVAKLRPEPVEGVEHADPAGVPEIAPFFVDPEVEQGEAPAGGELARPVEQHRLPVAAALLGEGVPLHAGRPDHVEVVLDPRRLLAQIVRRGGREPEMQSAGREDPAVERSAGGEDVEVVDLLEVRGDFAEPEDVAEELAEVVPGKVGVDHLDRPRRRAPPHLLQHRAHHGHRRAGVRAAHVGHGEDRAVVGRAHVFEALQDEGGGAVDDVLGAERRAGVVPAALHDDVAGGACHARDPLDDRPFLCHRRGGRKRAARGGRSPCAVAPTGPAHTDEAKNPAICMISIDLVHTAFRSGRTGSGG